MTFLGRNKKLHCGKKRKKRKKTDAIGYPALLLCFVCVFVPPFGSNGICLSWRHCTLRTAGDADLDVQTSSTSSSVFLCTFSRSNFVRAYRCAANFHFLSSMWGAKFAPTGGFAQRGQPLRDSRLSQQCCVVDRRRGSVCTRCFCWFA